MDEETLLRAARRDAVEDVLSLIHIFDQLREGGRHELWSSVTRALAESRWHDRETSDGQCIPDEAWIHDIITADCSAIELAAHCVREIRVVMSNASAPLASQLNALLRAHHHLLQLNSGVGPVLEAAVFALARQAATESKDDDGDPIELRSWLREQAGEAFPHDSDVALLVSSVSAISLEPLQDLFQWGLFESIVNPSRSDRSIVRDVYWTYMSMKVQYPGFADSPDPHSLLGIQVDEADFREWIDCGKSDGWQVNKAAWKAEIEKRCVERLAPDIAWWRNNFIARLLELGHVVTN